MSNHGVCTVGVTGYPLSFPIASSSASCSLSLSSHLDGGGWRLDQGREDWLRAVPARKKLPDMNDTGVSPSL